MQSHGDKMSAGTQIAMSAVIGGTAEALGGGKFANGAVTGAYVMMLNHLGQHGDGDNPQKGNDEKQKLSLKDKDLAKKVIELMNEIEQKKSDGNLTEIFDEETLYFDRNETTKTVEVVYENSIVEVTIVNPKYAPDYGYYYQIKSRPYQAFGRATFGSIDISGQKSVISLRIYNEKVYNQSYNEVFKNN